MLAMIPSVLRGVSLPDLERIKEITRAAFPSVLSIDTDALAVQMEADPASLLLVDVRSEREFAVSHLAGAIRAVTMETILEAAEQRGARNIVLYCSVGFRSAILASRLKGRGRYEVANLEGSIFAWANEGRPVFCGLKQVKLVHPHSNRWAGLLKPGLAFVVP